MTPLPRPPSRGLIEAQLPCRSPASHSRSLPRPPSRGLIEAIGIDPQVYCGFAPLPRPPSRGLIEARQFLLAHPLSFGLFPGHRAGASLKPSPVPPASNAIDTLFPGHRAGASLKRSRVRGDRPPPGALPRPPSRGLIEAPRSSRAAPGRAALFPGHRAGASLKRQRGAGRVGRRHDSSPATEPGPH